MEKERRTKALVIVVLLIVVAGLTVAFAALSTTLNINGTAYLDAAKWGIKFENLSSPTKIGSATTTGTAKIEETKAAEITGMNVSLSTPGDKVTYTVDLVNEGTINAKIDNIEKTVLTSEQQRYLTFKVTDRDGREVSEGDILSKGETRNLTITIEFIKDLTKEDLPKQTSTISLSYKLNFVQTDDKTVTTSGISKACTTFEKKDTYRVGDVIALCNNNTKVSEDFYVISDNGSTVTALAKYNLLVGNKFIYDESGETKTAISTSEEGYGLQSEKTKESLVIDASGNFTSYTVMGGIAFSNYDTSNIINNCYSSSEHCYYAYWGTADRGLNSKYGSSYPADVFDSNSNLYAPLKNYENYIKNTLNKTSASTKLLTYNEAIALGCDESTNSCASAPSWVTTTFYYLGSASGYPFIYIINPADSIQTDHGSSFSNSASPDGDFIIGLRPVITIKKSEL